MHSLIVASAASAVDWTEAIGGVRFEAGEGSGSVLLGGSGLGQLGLSLTSLVSLLLSSGDLCVAGLLSTTSGLSGALEEGLGVSSGGGSSLGLSVTKAVLLHGTSMDLLGGGCATRLLSGFGGAELSCALVLEKLLGGGGLRGLSGTEVPIELTAARTVTA